MVKNIFSSLNKIILQFEQIPIQIVAFQWSEGPLLTPMGAEGGNQLQLQALGLFCVLSQFAQLLRSASTSYIISFKGHMTYLS